MPQPGAFSENQGGPPRHKRESLIPASPGFGDTGLREETHGDTQRGTVEAFSALHAAETVFTCQSRWWERRVGAAGDSPCPALEVRLLFGEKSPSLAGLPVPACRQCWPPRLHTSPIASGAPRLSFLSHLTHEGLNPLCLRSRCVLDTSSLSPGTPPPFAPQPPSTWAFSGGLWPPGTGWVWSRHSYPIAQ